MCRGNDGQEIFRTDDGRRLFLSTLDEACRQTGWLIHAYVLMSNHYHILLETPEANLVAGMKWFQGAYTQRFNSMFQCRGHLFQGRYKAIPIATDPREGGLEYFREVSTYIHLNPYRAKLYGEGMGKPLQDYIWSSYPAYCGLAKKRPDWLVRKKVLRSWGLKEGETWSLRGYREKLERKMRFEEEPAAGIRGDFEKQIKRGWYIGSEEFRERLGTILVRQGQSDNLRGEQRRAHGASEAERIWREGLELLGVEEMELLNAKSTRMEKRALAWLMKKNTAVTVKWIAERTEMGHASTASLAINRFARDSSRKAIRMRGKLIKELIEK